MRDPAPRAQRIVWIFVLAAVASSTQWRCRESRKTTPSDAAVVEVPTPLVVRADDPSLLFSFRTDQGQYATAVEIKEIPESARAGVVVMDLDHTPEQRQAGRFVHVADLTQAREDGTYPVAVQSRYAFEAPPRTADAEAPASDGVVLYSASWCGVCKKARRLLSGWKVPFKEKDIESSRAAAQELAAKAHQSGFTPSGVPVIDVRGVLLRGLDEARLKGTLRSQGFDISP